MEENQMMIAKSRNIALVLWASVAITEIAPATASDFFAAAADRPTAAAQQNGRVSYHSINIDGLDIFYTTPRTEG